MKGDAELALVCVVIPVKNGGERLRECLSAVFAQQAPFPYEVICVDSGSTDDSIESIRKTRARLIQIAPAEFGHGRTRNLAISQTHASFVALLTQDAVPANDQWLAELIAPFKDEDVAGVFGPHLPHPGCSPMEEYSLERHFRNFGSTTTAYSIKPGVEGWDDYVARKPFYRFFSDNNAAVRRSIWSRIPYPDVEFMEDQLWAAAVLEAGYTKVYAPRAAVRHSHNYDALTLLRRGFDESRYFRQYFNDLEMPSLGQWSRHVRTASSLDGRQLRQDARFSTAEKVAWVGKAALSHSLQAAGRYLGDRHQLLPEAVVRRISQHHELKGDVEHRAESSTARRFLSTIDGARRSTGKLDFGLKVVRKVLFTVRHTRDHGPAKTIAALKAMTTSTQQPRPWWERSVYPYLDKPAPVPLRAQTRRSNPDNLTLNWVIPPFGVGGGGHLNIFRMVHHLERRGHRARIYVMDGRDVNSPEAAKMLADVHRYYVPIAAPVRHLDGDMEPADVAIATAWHTAYPVRASTSAQHKAYFIQDFEPSFFPVGAHSQLAEDTYRFGFFGITAGPWLQQIVTSRYGMKASSFPLAVEHHDYWPERGYRGPRRIFAYMRPHTERRGFEIVALALRRIHAEFPDVEIHVAGANLGPEVLPFPFTCHGILDTPRLRKLYSSCDVAICVSMTNYSLLPQEIAACGCPVVDIDAENTRAAYPQGAVCLVPVSVDGISSGVIRLLSDEAARKQQIKAGLQYVERLTWEESARLVDEALRQLVRGEGQVVGPRKTTLALAT